MNQELYDYIWENYRHLLEESTGYSKYLRAALFPINADWPDAQEVEELKGKFTSEALTEKFQEIECNKNKYIDVVYEAISSDIYFNYCPNCKALVISPKSERCTKCKHEWYGLNEHRENS